MKKTILIISILSVLILIGLVVSFSYRLSYEKTSQKKSTETPTAGELKTSPAQTITLSGEVKKLTDSILTITTGKETLEILINAETEITSVVPTEGEDGLIKPSGKEIQLKDIKIGDKVNISAKQEEGKLVGTSILVFPAK